MTPVNPAGLEKQARRFRPGGIKKTKPLVIPAIPVESRESRENWKSQESWESRESRESRESWESRESQESREIRCRGKEGTPGEPWAEAAEGNGLEKEKTLGVQHVSNSLNSGDSGESGGIKKTNPLVIPAIPVKSGTDVTELVKILVIR